MRLTCGPQRVIQCEVNPRLALVDLFFCSVSRHSKRAEQQLALEDPVNLDLPEVAYEMFAVRRDDLDLVTLVSEMGRRGHSAIGVDAEIWRLLRHYELPMPTRLVETRREFLGSGGRLPQSKSRCEAIGRIAPSCGGESYSQLSMDRSTPNSKRSLN
jgi:hypothetical protein